MLLHGVNFKFPIKLDEKYNSIINYIIKFPFLLMSVSFFRFFSTFDPNITVVSVIGRSNLTNDLPAKVACINDYFQKSVVCRDDLSLTQEVLKK